MLEPDVVVLVNAILAGLRVHDIPVDGEEVSERVIVPLNPFCPVTVIAVVPPVPIIALTLAGFALIVKSGAAPTVNVTVAVDDCAPLEPVTVTVNAPLAPLDAAHESVLVPEVTRVMLAGLKVQDNVPVPSTTVEVNVTVPVNPLMGETMIVEVAEPPAETLTLTGLAVTVKPGGLNGMSLVNLTSVGAEVP